MHKVNTSQIISLEVILARYDVFVLEESTENLQGPGRQRTWRAASSS